MTLAEPTSLTRSEPAVAADSVVRRLLAAFRSRPGAVAAIGWMGFIVVAAVFASQVAPYDPNAQDLNSIFSGPSLHHLLGTDQLGRDTLSRVIFAGRVALPAAGLAVVVAVGVGVPIGLAVGYAGGVWDRVAMRIVDAVLALPGLVIAIAVVGAIGPGMTHAMVTLGFLASAGFARLTRGIVLAVREQPFVEAARVTGESTVHVLVFEVLPNAVGPIIVQATLAFAQLLLAEAALSFIGLGAQPPATSWGSMLADARTQIGNDAFLAVPPGLALLLTVLAGQVIGDTLRAVFVRGPADSARRGWTRWLPAILAGAFRAVRVNTRADASGGVASDDEPGRVVGTATPTASDDLASEDSGLLVPEDAVLSVEHLRVSVRSPSGVATVVDDVSFALARGETLGLVGESGCGKSMTALSLMRLLPAGASVTSGRIRLNGQDLLALSEREMTKVRGHRIAVIFQDPISSLDPAFTIGNQLSEPLRIHLGLSRRSAWRQAVELLERVRLPDAANRVRDYPHQLSGGQLQRVMIAAALACSPDVLVADEPTTALDVTVQGKILDLLADLRQEFGMAMVFVSHDLGVIADLCDRVLVMYAGQIVEAADVVPLFERPGHPYTDQLLNTLPERNRKGVRLARIKGQVPAPEAWATDRCRFADRCEHVIPACLAAMPPLRARQGGLTRCIRADQLAEVREQ